MSNSSESKAIAFTFTKKVKQNPILVKNILNKDLKTSDGNEEKDFVISIDDKHINSVVEKDVKKDLVIPLIVNNRYSVKSKPDLDQLEPKKTQSVTNGEKEPKREETLEELAKKELLREATDCKEEKSETESSRVIPVMDTLMTNRVSEGFESDNNFDVSLRPIESTLEDYETVPVQEFGLALLRGMGWKPGMPIGANTKQTYIPVEPQIRPKGLGLGAEASIRPKIPKKSQDLKEEELQTKKGSFVCIEFGAHKGLYGVIEDFDDDMSRVTIKLTISKESIKTPVALVRVVSKKEFQNEGKVINKTKFEEYKQKEGKQEKSEERDRRHRSEHSRHRSESDRKHRRHRERDRH